MRAAVIDDEAGCRRALTRILAREGVATEEADSLESGDALLRSDHFDLATIDLRLPGLAGSTGGFFVPGADHRRDAGPGPGGRHG